MSEQNAADSSVPSEQEFEDATEDERWDEGTEQVPPEEPTIGEAVNDVDFDTNDNADPYDEDASDDPLHRGGHPLGEEGLEDNA